ncbi:MAG: 2-C-methyl-D-erythritol 4-phosphate cytidylyltransferase [Acidobacteriota bacterium]
MNTAIIVAAGSGQRFASSQPKQFIPILGKPLIIHTLERFEASPVIDEIVLVLSMEGRDEFALISGKYTFPKLRPVVTGGKTRAESVRNGLDVVEASTSKVVAVHDGARPLVSLDEIARTIEKAEEIGAACLVGEVTDTIKEIDGEYIFGTIDRRGLRRALTPQAFRYDILRKAFEGVDLAESVTDECSLVEDLGVKIAFVSGSARNIKVTHPEDLLLAEALLSNA